MDGEPPDGGLPRTMAQWTGEQPAVFRACRGASGKLRRRRVGGRGRPGKKRLQRKKRCTHAQAHACTRTRTRAQTRAHTGCDSLVFGKMSRHTCGIPTTSSDGRSQVTPTLSASESSFMGRKEPGHDAFGAGRGRPGPGPLPTPGLRTSGPQRGAAACRRRGTARRRRRRP